MQYLVIIVFDFLILYTFMYPFFFKYESLENRFVSDICISLANFFNSCISLHVLDDMYRSIFLFIDCLIGVHLRVWFIQLEFKIYLNTLSV